MNKKFEGAPATPEMPEEKGAKTYMEHIISKENYEKTISVLRELRDKKNWGSFFSLAEKLKIAYPERVNDLNLNDKEVLLGIKKPVAIDMDKEGAIYYSSLTGHAEKMKVLLILGWNWRSRTTPSGWY